MTNTYKYAGTTNGKGEWGNEFPLDRDPTIGEFKKLFDAYADDCSADDYERVGSHSSLLTQVRVVCANDRDSEYQLLALELDQLGGCGCPAGIVLLIVDTEFEKQKQQWIEEGVRRAFDIVKNAAANTDHDQWADQLEDVADIILDSAPTLKSKWHNIYELQGEIYRLKRELKGDKNG